MSLSLVSRIDNLSVLVNHVISSHAKDVERINNEIATLKRALAGSPKTSQQKKVVVSDSEESSSDDNNDSYNPVSSESESESEPESSLKRVLRRKRKSPTTAATGDSFETSDSEPDSDFVPEPETEKEEERTRPLRKKPKTPTTAEVGDIFETRDGYCIVISEDECGWLYRHQDLPKHLKDSVPKKDLFISDHDFINLDYDGQGVTKLPTVSRDSLVARIRKDAVFLADSDSIKKSQIIPYSPSRALRILQDEWECQTHFGMPSKNRLHSDRILHDMADGEMNISKLDEPYSGKCMACNMTPKWNSHKVTIKDSENFEEELHVGETCKSRLEILRDFVNSESVDPWYVFGFKLLDTVHSLTHLKSEANATARRFLNK